MHHPTDTIVHTTAFRIPAGTRNNPMGVPGKIGRTVNKCAITELYLAPLLERCDY